MRDGQRGRVLVLNGVPFHPRAGKGASMNAEAGDTATTKPWDKFAAALRGFGPAGTIVFVAVIMLVAVIPFPLDLATVAGAIVIVVWARASRTPLHELGFVPPQSWIGGLLIGIALGVAINLAMKAMVMPLFGAPAINPGIAHLIGSPKRIAISIVYMIVSAGLCEEIVFRGYLFERLGKMLGDAFASRLLILVVSALIFGLAHFQSGLFSMLNAGIGGLILGALFFVNHKRLWMVMVTHAANDLCALAIAVFHLQAAVSHSAFR
jgi:CAAX protease family protein